jgi:uncharacterized protein
MCAKPFCIPAIDISSRPNRAVYASIALRPPWSPSLQQCTIVHVLVEWDPRKAKLNVRKHDVEFADAVAVLEDERALTMADSSSHEEERWVTIGLDAFGRVIVLIYTWRGEHVRLISARKATRLERRFYQEGAEYET